VWTLLNDTITENTGTANLEFLGVGTPAAADTGAFAGTVTIAGATVTGAGTSFLSDFASSGVPSAEGLLFKADADGILDWTRIKSVDSDTQITLVEAYRGATAGPGAAASWVKHLGGVEPGDIFEYSGGTFRVSQVVANVVTLTSDTGVSPGADFAGAFSRELW